MDSMLSEDQRLLKESAEKLAADAYSFEMLVATTRDGEGFSRALWAKFAALGWLGLPLPEQAGGLGGGAADVAVIAEAFGRYLLPEPFVSTVILGARLVAGAGSPAQRAAILPGVIGGRTLLALAHGESATRFDPMAIATTATREGSGWVLRGAKTMAIGGPSADILIVSALLPAGGIGLFLLPRATRGLATAPLRLIDGRRACDLVLDGVTLGAEALLGGEEDRSPLILETVDHAILAAASAAVGAMDALRRKTAAYLTMRVQFGEPLSARQALRHRVADMAIRGEEARAIVLRATLIADRTTDPAARMRAVSGAKAKAARAARFVGAQAIQLHGAMGVTEELDVASYFRALLAFELTFGSSDQHRRRFAALTPVAGEDRSGSPDAGEDAAFRAEVRAFLAAELTDAMRRAHALTPSVFDDPEVVRAWQSALHRRGWAAPGWPREAGGPGWSPARRMIFEEECARAGAPNLAPMGLRMVGPVLIRYGSAEQKARYLPRILSGEDYWCQGYSEPGSGSDLASLQTKAVRDGDDYVINGTKIWTTHAHHANRMFALVRTSQSARRQDGISFILIDMDTPGISVRPILTAGGDHEVNQVFFDDVRVPCRNLVGEEGAGWTYGKYLLEFERGGNSVSGRLRAMLDDHRRLAAKLGRDRAGAGPDPFADRFADLAMDIDAFEMNELRVMRIVQAGGSPGLLASYVKVMNSELRQAVSRLGVDVLGERGLVWEPDRPLYHLDHAATLDEDELPVMPTFLNARAATIYGGSGEVQRDIIAKALLG